MPYFQTILERWHIGTNRTLAALRKEIQDEIRRISSIREFIQAKFELIAHIDDKKNVLTQISNLDGTLENQLSRILSEEKEKISLQIRLLLRKALELQSGQTQDIVPRHLKKMEEELAHIESDFVKLHQSIREELSLLKLIESVSLSECLKYKNKLDSLFRSQLQVIDMIEEKLQQLDHDIAASFFDELIGSTEYRCRYCGFTNSVIQEKDRISFIPIRYKYTFKCLHCKKADTATDEDPYTLKRLEEAWRR